MIFHGCFLSNGAWLVALHVCFDTNFEHSVLFNLLAVRFAQREESLHHGPHSQCFIRFSDTTCKSFPLILQMNMREPQVHIIFG